MADTNKTITDKTNNVAAQTEDLGYLKDGQRASYIRYSMENKNLLENKYDIYVGTGEVTGTDVMEQGVSRGTKGINIIDAINEATAETNASDINIRNGLLLLGYPTTQNANRFIIQSTQPVHFKTSQYILEGGDDGSSADVYVFDKLYFNVNEGIYIRNYDNNQLYTIIKEDNKGCFNITGKAFSLKVGDAASNTEKIYIDDSSLNLKGMIITGGDANLSSLTTTGDIEIRTNTSGGTLSALKLATSGNITCAAITASGAITSKKQIEGLSFNATSDERLKTNIQTLNYHDSILDVPVREYDWKATGKHAIGFVAQELQRVYPELVDEGENGMLSIKETKLVYLLMEEVKKLKEEIENLKKEG